MKDLQEKNFKIVLFQPEIPGNTGSIGRTCVALNIELILIRPYGFDLSEKAVRRAGLDYWKFVHLKEYDTWEDFLKGENPEKEDLILFSRFGKKVFYEAPYTRQSYLIFGSETKGLSAHIRTEYLANLYTIPSYSPHIRSLNLANAATAAAYEGIRQIYFSHT